jgi:AraC family transcriptional regulator
MEGQTLMKRGCDYRVDARFVMPGANLQLRTYHHEAPSRAGKARSNHVLSVSLVGRPRGSTGRFIRDRRATGPFHFGNITFVPGGVPIVGWGPGGIQHTLSCSLEFGAFAELEALEQGLSEEQLLACGNIRAPHLEEMMRRLAGELRSPGFARETMIDLLVRGAVIDVARHVRHKEPAAPRHSGGLSPAMLRRVTDYIADTLDQSPTIAELAAVCGVSAGHLMRSFRQATGETIHAHVQRVRVERAQTLLAEPGLSIKEIAHSLGFASSSSFSVAFRRLCGTSPSALRRDYTGAPR